MGLLERLVDRIVATPLESDGLSYGRSGVALLLAYYARLTGSTDHHHKCIELISSVFNRFNTPESSINSPDYYNGLIGFTWVVDHLRRNDFFELDSTELDYFDSIIFNWTVTELESGNYDFFSGGAGGLNYLAHRSETAEEHRERIERLLSALGRCTQVSGKHGIPINKKYNRGEGFSENTINYGLAHGVASIAVFLARVVQSFPDCTNAKDSLVAIVESFRRHAAEFSESQYYGYANLYDCDTNKPLVQQRLGWCAGDLNQVQIESLTGAVTGCRTYTRSAATNFEKVLSRNTPALHGVADHHLCHGYAGLLVYTNALNRKFHNQNCPSFSVHCIDNILGHYRKESSSSTSRPAKTDSLFYGDVGVALSIVSTLRPDLAGWTEIILI